MCIRDSASAVALAGVLLSIVAHDALAQREGDSALAPHGRAKRDAHVEACVEAATHAMVERREACDDAFMACVLSSCTGKKKGKVRDDCAAGCVRASRACAPIDELERELDRAEAECRDAATREGATRQRERARMWLRKDTTRSHARAAQQAATSR